MSANLINMALLAVLLPLATAVGRWQIGKDRWAKYPGGSNGYLKDCLIVAIGLFGICAGCAAWSVMAPGQTRIVTAGALILAGVVFGYVPFGRGATLRLLEARYAARDAHNAAQKGKGK